MIGDFLCQDPGPLSLNASLSDPMLTKQLADWSELSLAPLFSQPDWANGVTGDAETTDRYA
jgi:hypothetical protein